MKRNIILIISLVAGLAAAVLTRVYLASKAAEYERDRRRLIERYGAIEVVAYTRAVPAGTVLTKDDLGSLRVPQMGLRGQAVELEDFRELIGRKTVVSHDRGEVVFWSDIEGGDPKIKGLSNSITKHMRAISINVTGAASVSGMIKPNDHVDVIGTFDVPSDDDERKLKRGDPVTCTILQNVLVLATGRQTANARPRDLGLGAQQGYATVTLEVTPREAEMLAFAEQIRGRLLLTLRNGNDTSSETELPDIDFLKIRAEMSDLNKKRQMERSARYGGK